MCPISATARALVGQILEKLLRDTAYVTSMSNMSEAAHALTLIGVDEGVLATAFLVMPCTMQLQYDPYCSDTDAPPDESQPFWNTRNRCSRLGCEGAGIVTSTVYFTERPHTEADDRHAFTYEATSPAGTATYDPNPLVRWVADTVAMSPSIVVTAAIDQRLTFEPEGEGALALAHEGPVRFIMRDGDVRSGAIDLSFPSLVSGGEPVESTLAIDAAGEISGAITHDGATLATLGGHDVELIVSWAGGCE